MRRLEAYKKDWFEDSYNVKMVLRDEDGRIYEEEYDEMSLTDFEVLYGQISDEMIECHLTHKSKGLTDDE